MVKSRWTLVRQTGYCGADFRREEAVAGNGYPVTGTSDGPRGGSAPLGLCCFQTSLGLRTSGLVLFSWVQPGVTVLVISQGSGA